MCQEALQYNKMTKPAFLSWAGGGWKSPLHITRTFCVLLPCYFKTKSTVLSLMSHLTITSRAETETGLTAHTESNILKEFLRVNKRFGREPLYSQ